MLDTNKMSRSKLFEKLGAPLKNTRWSWGAISESGNVYLAVWTDQFRGIKEKSFVRLTDNKASGSKPRNLGYLERLEHCSPNKERGQVLLCFVHC